MYDVLNCDKISCRKISLNFGLLFQNLIYIGNLNTLLQLLILNKAYYLEIKTGLINESYQLFSTLQPFWKTILEQEVGKRGISLYHTWHIANSIHHITLHHIISCYIIWYHILSHCYQIASPHIPFYSILLCPTWILSHHTTSYPIHCDHYQILLLTIVDILVHWPLTRTDVGMSIIPWHFASLNYI